MGKSSCDIKFSWQEKVLYGLIFVGLIVGVAYGFECLYEYAPVEVQHNILVDGMHWIAVFVTSVTNVVIDCVAKFGKDGYGIFCELVKNAREIFYS